MVTAEIGSMVGVSFEIICVDDGSVDSTLVQLINLSLSDPRVLVLELSRNFGKEAALSAGIDFAVGEAVIPFDADLQDPPSLIRLLVEAWQEKDADVVLAKRTDRTSDSFLKRFTAKAFYFIHNLMSHPRLPESVGDCRLMSRAVVDALKLMTEKQRFMKGLFAWVGFRAVTIEYVRERRYAGVTKFSGWKLWNLALEGITSFSSWPLRVWTYIGTIGALLALGYGAFITLRTIIFGATVPGYASLLVVGIFFGSMQLIGLGVLGEYIGRIYTESKNRPLYLVRKTHGQKIKFLYD
jgi:glycosyltransferase involved in cell wall biosynthesis